MRIISLLLIAVLLIAGGCDQEAARQQQGRKQFDEILAALRDVELGYVSASPEEVVADNPKDPAAHRQSMELFRQEQLKKTFVILQPILENGNDYTVEQQVDARRLAADIYTSSARFQMRQLNDSWTNLSARSVVMMSYLVAVGRNQSLAQNMQIDDKPLIEQIKKTLRDTTVELEKREKEATQVTSKADEFKKSIAELKKQIDALDAQAQKLKSDAFVAKGKEKYKLLDDASSIARQAAILDARRQVDQAQLENINAQKAMLTEQIDFSLEFIDSLERQIEDATKRQKLGEEQTIRAKQEMTDAEQRFLDEFNAVVEQFSTVVYPQFAQVNSEMDRALGMLNKAHGLASGEDRQMIEIELLSKEVAALNMQTSMSMIINDMGNKYQQILNRATKGKHTLMADRKATFQSAYEDMQRKQTGINQQAQKLLEQARQQSTTTLSLVSTDGPLTRLAKNARSTDMDKLTQTTEQLNGLLDTYAKRLNDFALK